MAADISKGVDRTVAPGDREDALRVLYRQLADADTRLRSLEWVTSPYTRVEAEMLRRRHADIARQINALIERRRKI